MIGMEQRVMRAARLIHEAADDDRDGELPPALLNGLDEIVPGGWVCFSELDLAMRRTISFQSSRAAPPDDDAGEDAFWRGYPELRPCHYLYDGNVTRDDVVRLSDFTSYRDLVNTVLYQEYLLPNGERYEMFVPLPTSPGRTRVLVFCRWDDDFTEAERDLLTLLRPHLVALHEARRLHRAGIPRLTARQWQVLRCLVAGQSTEQVAAAMCVSRSTVRKHLENIYERMGVTSRTAAVGRAFAVASPPTADLPG